MHETDFDVKPFRDGRQRSMLTVLLLAGVLGRFRRWLPAFALPEQRVTLLSRLTNALHTIREHLSLLYHNGCASIRDDFATCDARAAAGIAREDIAGVVRDIEECVKTRCGDDAFDYVLLRCERVGEKLLGGAIRAAMPDCAFDMAGSYAPGTLMLLTDLRCHDVPAYRITEEV